MERVKNRVENAISSGEILISKGLYKEAIVAFWTGIRTIVFYELKNKEIQFQSTEEAIKEFVKLHSDSEISESVIFLEKTALLCEWDIFFCVKYSQVQEYQNICMNFIGNFLLLSNTNNGTHYNLLKEEINRHIEDLYFTKSQQFSASSYHDKLYKRYLIIGFIVSLVGLSSFFYVLTTGTASGLIITQAVTLLGACVTIWPLVRDYSGKAVMHRRFADEYGRIYKISRNWVTDFPNDSRLQDAEKSVVLIRRLIMTVNSLTPATSEDDYKCAKESFDLNKDEIFIK
jgi:hypothetical protein